MIRVALLGSDSTHTEAFATRLAARTDARVSALWGEDPEQTRAKGTALGVPTCATVAEALAEADLAMVIGRFGESHAAPARAALARGIATFVDKPFTTSAVEARALVAEAHARHTPIGSASALRFAREVRAAVDRRGAWSMLTVTVPLECTDLGDDVRFRSPFFYGIHGAEVLLEIAGEVPQAVEVVRESSGVTVTARFAAGRCGVLRLERDMDERYVVTLDAASGGVATEITLDGHYYDGLLDALLAAHRAGGPVVAPESTIAAVTMLAMIETGDPWTAP